MDFQQFNQQQPGQQPINPQPEPNIQPNPIFTQPPKNSWKVTVLVIIGALVLGGASYGAYYYWQNSKPVACTTEAKICPDGSSVGRFGPNCEFAECPADPTANWQTYKNDKYGFELKFPERWGDYKAVEKIIESENVVGVISFQLKYKTGTSYQVTGYGDIFLIDIYPIDWWNENVSVDSMDYKEVYLKGSEQNLGTYLGSYIAKNDKYAFTSFLGHDDEGFAGFPDVIGGQPYEGPYYDVNYLILPTFKFTSQ